MSRFDSVLAEAAYVITMHGFVVDEFSTSVDGDAWNALVDTSATVLLNLGEVDLRERYVAAHGDAVGGLLVWIHEDPQGFVSVIEFGSDADARSGTDAVRRVFDDGRSA